MQKCFKFKTFYFLVIVFTFYFLLFNSALAQENNSDPGSTTLRVDYGASKILELRNQIQELERQSAEYRKQITEKQQEGETLKRELSILENRIAKLRVDILSTNRRIELTGLEIKDLTGEILTTEKKIDTSKESISELLRQINNAERQDLASILLANPRISDFFNHVQYVNSLQKQLSANLKTFLDLKDELESRKETAENKKQELVNLNRKQGIQKSSSETTKTTKNNLLTQTKGLEQKFQELLTETERKTAEFYTELRKYEEQAREQGRYIVRVKAPVIPPKGKIFKMPMEDYIITQGYGMTAFVRKRPDIYGGVPHNGIDLKAGPGSEIHSIGAGTVLAKGFNNAAGNWVAIRHDNDLVSIYAHMKEPTLVLANERVSENTILGFEGATGLATGSHLHLSLYHEFFTFIGPITGQIYFNSWEGSLNPFDYL